MQAGKIPLELLSKLLDSIETTDPSVVLGPKPGEDAAIIDLNNRYLVTKMDPITFATDHIAWYLVNVNANDLAVMGAKPRWLMASLLFPEGTTPESITKTFNELIMACENLGISLVGGHTEITYGISRPIAVGAMFGEVKKKRVVLTSGAKPGDTILLTKGIAIEGASIFAREATNELKCAGIKPNILKRAKDFIFNPGISVLKEAIIACDAVKLNCMHDPTEGGLVTGLHEIAKAAGVGMVVNADRIPVLPECQSICEALDVDPLGLISSGALLATLSPLEASKLIKILADQGIPAYDIGRITLPEDGMKLIRKEISQDMPVFKRDELARYFGSNPQSTSSENLH
jgi:hydrogenase expression/formation protein HypE